MFTGIVDHVGVIQLFDHDVQGARLIIETQFRNFQLGESIAVNGVCLTVTQFADSQFTVELSQETLSKTNFKNLKIGEKVNLERPLRMGDALGGHFVTGHVDDTIKVKFVERETSTAGVLTMVVGFAEVHPSYQTYLVPKGSIAINGVSLTINKVWEGGFQVTLIPHTLERTHLNDFVSGSIVNVEYD